MKYAAVDMDKKMPLRLSAPSYPHVYRQSDEIQSTSTVIF